MAPSPMTQTTSPADQPVTARTGPPRVRRSPLPRRLPLVRRGRAPARPGRHGVRRPERRRARPTWSRRSATSPRSAATGSPPTRRWCGSAPSGRSSAVRVVRDDRPTLVELEINPGPGQPRPDQPARRCRGRARCSGIAAHGAVRARGPRAGQGRPGGAAPLPRRPAGRAHAAAGRRACRLRPGAQAAQRVAEVGRRGAPARGAAADLSHPRRLGHATWRPPGAELLAARLELVDRAAPAGRQGLRRGRAAAAARRRSTTVSRRRRRRRCVARPGPARRARCWRPSPRPPQRELERGVTLVGPHRDDLRADARARCRPRATPATASRGRSRWRCGWPPTTCSRGRRRRAGADPRRRLRRARRRPPRAAGRAGRAGRAGAGHGRGGAGRPGALSGVRVDVLAGEVRRAGDLPADAADRADRPSCRATRPTEPPPLPPPSGVDLARALLAAGPRRRQSQGTGPASARPLRTGDADGPAPQRRATRTTATRSRSAAAVERLVAERGWEAEAAVGGRHGPLGPQSSAPTWPPHCRPRATTRRRPDGPRRLDGLGDPGPAAGTEPGRPAQRRVRRRHGHAGCTCSVPAGRPGARAAVPRHGPGPARHLRLTGAAARPGERHATGVQRDSPQLRSARVHGGRLGTRAGTFGRRRPVHERPSLRQLWTAPRTA